MKAPSNAANDLIYDVGMNNGDDTAYYLHLGFRVVAIEADPVLVQAANERFAREVSAGRLKVLPIGIHSQVGTLPFWICEGKSEWNSFDPHYAARRGRTAHPIEVPCRPFRDILAEFGPAHYVKIDIESCERCCLDDLHRHALPRYLSTEVNGLEELELLKGLGFNAFKLVRQGRHAPVLDETRTLKAWAAAHIGKSPRLSNAMGKSWTIGRKLAKLARRAAHGFRQPVQQGWQFPFGSTGPFGEDAPGEWIEFEEVVYRFLALKRSSPQGMWCDVHATQLRALGATASIPARTQRSCAA